MAKLFESEFHKGVMVAVVDDMDYQYQILAPLFNEYGYGFVLPDQKLIFIEGTHDKDVQKMVEAHEVGHIVMGHTGIKGPNDEAQADSWAIMNLRRRGYKAEADELQRNFKFRNGYPYNHIQNSRNKKEALKHTFI